MKNSNLLLVIMAIVIGVSSVIVFTQTEEIQWSAIETFSSDNYGNYQTWCTSNDGKWFADTMECKFEHQDEYAKAILNLDYIENEKYRITGNYALAMCQLLGISCIDDLYFQGHFDMETSYVKYDYQSDKAEFSFRLADDMLEYKGKKLVDGRWIGSDEHWVKLELTHLPEISSVLDDVKAGNEPTTPDEVIKSITLHNVPYLELVENEQEYVGKMLHYYGKISDVDEYGFADSTAKIAVTPGAGWVDLLELTYNELNLADGNFKEVWGTYNGINEDTGLPMIQVFIIE